jgi:hypothetical protein
MQNRKFLLTVIAILPAAAIVAASGVAAVPQAPSAPSQSDLRSMIGRFAPAEIIADTGSLPPNERQALGKIVEAARLMDSLFLEQVWAGNDALLQQLARATGTAEATPSNANAAARLHYFLINKGPWSRLDHNRPFIDGVPAKPEAANFYPAGASKEEVQKWIDSLSGDEKARATGFFTTIRRSPDVHLVGVPYSVE